VPAKALIWRWDGTRWNDVPIPNPGKDNYLNGVWATGTGEAWAVGQHTPGTGWDPLVLRWDGSEWRQTTVPKPAGSTGAILTAVSGTSPTDVWAVGEYFDAGRVNRSLVEHWDGTKWTVVPSPMSSRHDTLMGVSAQSRSNVWAVGDSMDPVTGDFTPLILHWDGVQWSSVPAPVGAGSAFGVAALSGRDVWVAGRRGRGNQLTARWNGFRWIVADDEAPGWLVGMTAFGPRELFTVGFRALTSQEPVVRRGRC
jgi:hypothetical protein